jgi:ribosomal protein L37AE/L43A
VQDWKQKMKRKKQPCPRCNSARLSKRLSGENYCERCGQRWTKDGIIIQSFDKRKISDKSRVPKEEQLPLITG